MGSSYLFLNDLRIHYLHWNLAEGGRPVVLLHGLASNARIWELLAPRLAPAGLVPLSPDMRGHGLTDKPDGDYGFETFCKDLFAFIEAVHLERPVLVGHSWGALVGLDYAARFPVGPRAPAGLMLVDGGVSQLNDGSGATWEQTRDRLTPPRLAGLSQEELLASLTEWTSPWSQDDEVLQILLANFEIAEDETVRPRLAFERHMRIVRAIWEFNVYERLERIRCPAQAVLAIPPKPHFPPEAEFIASQRRGVERARAALPALQVHWLPDTVHDIPLHRPAELANLIVAFAETLPAFPAG